MHKFEKLHSKLSEILSMDEGNKTLESVKTELTCYESFIKELFAVTGEGKNIATIFESTTDETVTVECVDLYKVKDVYSEYIGGMMNFMEEILSANTLNESEELQGLEEKFSKAKSNDEKFIESLCTKYTETETLPLTEATGNITFLVDFVPELNVVKNYCESMTSKVGTRTDELSTGSLNMLYESVSHYCHKMISESLKIYESIDSIKNGETVGSEEKEVFKLF